MTVMRARELIQGIIDRHSGHELLVYIHVTVFVKNVLQEELIRRLEGIPPGVIEEWYFRPGRRQEEEYLSLTFRLREMCMLAGAENPSVRLHERGVF